MMIRHHLSLVYAPTLVRYGAPIRSDGKKPFISPNDLPVHQLELKGPAADLACHLMLRETSFLF